MATRYYLVPVIGTGFDHLNMRRPKYFSQLTGVPYQTIYYGHLPTVLIQADLLQAVHDQIVAQPDVAVFPVNLNQAINLAAVQTALSARNIPAGWLNGSLTYLQVVKRLRALFLFAQRYQAWLAHKIVEALWDNDVTLASLPGFLIDDLQETATSLGLDTTGITGQTTIADMMVTLAQQLENRV